VKTLALALLILVAGFPGQLEARRGCSSSMAGLIEKHTQESRGMFHKALGHTLQATSRTLTVAWIVFMTQEFRNVSDIVVETQEIESLIDIERARNDGVESAIEILRKKAAQAD